MKRDRHPQQIDTGTAQRRLRGLRDAAACKKGWRFHWFDIMQWSMTSCWLCSNRTVWGCLKKKPKPTRIRKLIHELSLHYMQQSWSALCRRTWLSLVIITGPHAWTMCAYRILLYYREQEKILFDEDHLTEIFIQTWAWSYWPASSSYMMCSLGHIEIVYTLDHKSTWISNKSMGFNGHRESVALAYKLQLHLEAKWRYHI